MTERHVKRERVEVSGLGDFSRHKKKGKCKWQYIGSVTAKNRLKHAKKNNHGDVKKSIYLQDYLLDQRYRGHIHKSYWANTHIRTLRGAVIIYRFYGFHRDLTVKYVNTKLHSHVTYVSYIIILYYCFICITT